MHAASFRLHVYGPSKDARERASVNAVSFLAHH